MRDSRSLEMLEILATYGPTREDPFFPARKHPCTGITLAKQEPNRPRNRSGRAFLDSCVAEVPRAIRILPVHPGANSLLTTQKSKHFVVRVFAYPPTTTDTCPATTACSSTSYVVRANIYQGVLCDHMPRNNTQRGPSGQYGHLLNTLALLGSRMTKHSGRVACSHTPRLTQNQRLGAFHRCISTMTSVM
jgi:hypothetical protein